jgi:hypothetical protein
LVFRAKEVHVLKVLENGVLRVDLRERERERERGGDTRLEKNT